jgi:FtsZ-interacting cell division protein ZipA
VWLGGIWVPVGKEVFLGICLLLVVVLVVFLAITLKNRKKDKVDFSAKNLERADKKFFKKKEEVNYDDLPIVDLKWQKGEDGGKQASSESDFMPEDEDDEDDSVDDGYTVVEKTIQEKAQKLDFSPQKQSAKSPPSPAKEPKKEVKPIKKDATGDKMDFFTTGKSAL